MAGTSYGPEAGEFSYMTGTGITSHLNHKNSYTNTFFITSYTPEKEVDSTYEFSAITNCS